ncbi:MAG: hypothetical protein V8R55_08095 [Dysosmobacter sp.]
MAVVQLDLYSYQLAMNTQVTLLLPERRGVPHAARQGQPYRFSICCTDTGRITPAGCA